MMGMTRRAGIIAAAIAAMATGAAGGDLPRYRLEPGMVLSYRGAVTFKYEGGAYFDEQETTAWIARRNADGGVRVIVRQGSRFVSAADEGALKGLIAKIKDALDPKDAEPMDYVLGYFDLSPEGRIGSDSDPGFQIDPASLFPRLPDDPAQAESGWRQRSEPIGQEYGYSSLRSEPGGWVFRGDRIGPEKAIYGMVVDSTYHFDADRGAIRRIEQEIQQEYGFKGKGGGTIELTGVERKDAAWVSTFAPASDRYIAAMDSYRKATGASKEARDARALLADAKAHLQDARDAIDHPILREELDRTLANHDKMIEYYVESANRRAGVVGKPSPDWSLVGIDGKTHALADYRGKVVVLDFWYRGCGWCVKAMPQINELAERFRGRPVAILGMNTDEKEDDAKFVIDAMGLKYETLRAKGIPEKYNVQGFPTLILIGPDGIVKDFHVGYSPTLGADVAKEIEGLLPSEPTPKP